MKRFIHTVVFYFFTLGLTYAQADITLNVRLFPIQVIEVNPIQEAIALDYQTTADYADGALMSHQPDHLSMFSTEGFFVKVESANTYIINDRAENIPFSDIIISPNLGTTNPLVGANLNSIDLSEKASTIIKNNTGAINKTFGIDYQTKSSDDYLDANSTESVSAIITNIIYSIETL